MYRPLLAALAALAMTPAVAQDAVLSPEEIKAKIVGKKLFVRTSGGALVDFVLHADGTATADAGNNRRDTGTWRLNDTGYCTVWRYTRQGQEACFRIVRRGTDTVILGAEGNVDSQILRTVD